MSRFFGWFARRTLETASTAAEPGTVGAIEPVMFDWKRRLLEIGLAGGLAATGASCNQTCLNCCGTPGPSVPATYLDKHPVTTSLLGCPAPPASPPAPYGNPTAKNTFCTQDSEVGASVLIDDKTLGYSPQDVLDAANLGATGSLTWWDGTTTKLHFQLATTPMTELHILDNPPNAGFCDRSMRLWYLTATFKTDDGRLAESIAANVIVNDFGQPFTPEDVSVNFDQPFLDRTNPTSLAGTKGTLATDLAGFFPSGTTVSDFSLSLFLKGMSCAPGCAPGASPNGMDPPGGSCTGSSGVILANVYCQKPVYVARWQWD
jgi:hypothetical protein